MDFIFIKFCLFDGYNNLSIFSILVMLLPTLKPSMLPPNVCPLLVFVNVKSGGGQGVHLITSFRKLLNPHQVFDLANGGPLCGYDSLFDH